MMGYTDRHARYLYRLIAPSAWLYTEMVTARALYHGDEANLLAHDPREQPLALQVGGSEPDLMARAALLAQNRGFNEININVGCPSDRVYSGNFGACLMASPDIVATCVKAMRKAATLPVTVKTRIGIDHRDSYPELVDFIGQVAEAGCNLFIIHARKAWLQGLSPRQNRDVPPLDYARVYRLKADFPQLQIVINGGITSFRQAREHLQHVDGVMLGREITRDPWLLGQLERLADDTSQPRTRAAVRFTYAEYMQRELQRGSSVHALVKPLAGLYRGQPGAGTWRRMLSDAAQGRVGKIDDLPQLVSDYAEKPEAR